MSKSIAKNSIYNIIYKGFTALFPLLTTTYVSRVLLAEGVGKVSYANTIVTYFVFIASLGIPNYGVKAIAQYQDNKTKQTTTALELLIINAISTTICLIIYYALVNISPYFSKRSTLFNVFGLMLFLNYFNIDWFYHGTEEYLYIAKRSIAVKIISFFLILLFVKKPSDYIIYAFILCVATAGNYLMNAYNLKRYISKEKDRLEISKHVKPVLVLLAAALAQEVYTMLDTVMLEFWHGEVYVGYYSNSVKLIRMVYTLTIAMVGAFYPRISLYVKKKQYKEANRLLSLGLKLIMLIAVPSVVGIFSLADKLIPVLFGNSFIPAISTIRILSILIVVFSTAYFLGHLPLMASGKEKYILYATVAGAVTNFTLNSVLIPRLMHNGAAIASVAAEIIVTSMLIIKSCKLFRLNISNKFILDIFVASTIMGVLINVIKSMFFNDFVCLSISVIFGVIIYFSILIVRKNDLVQFAVENVIKKLRSL